MSHSLSLMAEAVELVSRLGVLIMRMQVASLALRVRSAFSLSVGIVGGPEVLGADDGLGEWGLHGP